MKKPMTDKAVCASIIKYKLCVFPPGNKWTKIQWDNHGKKNPELWTIFRNNHWGNDGQWAGKTLRQAVANAAQSIRGKS